MECDGKKEKSGIGTGGGVNLETPIGEGQVKWKGVMMTQHMKMTEILRNPDDSIDEIVCDRCAFHLEQMADNHWWVEIETKKGSVHISLHARGKITATVDDER
jgi:hypothetical protein